jgi:7-carboxy-7-deazaguanine synthase
VDTVVASGTEIAVITGGEPAMYNLEALTAALKSKNIRTNIETSGAYPLTGTWDWVCLSPKKFKAPVDSVFHQADELKIIVFNKSDFEWAEKHAALVRPDCELFLQPEWSKEKEMTPLIIDYVKQNPKWKVSLQIHKYMNIP